MGGIGGWGGGFGGQGGVYMGHGFARGGRRLKVRVLSVVGYEGGWVEG